jgi:Protein of unknown function (DUF3108)
MKEPLLLLTLALVATEASADSRKLHAACGNPPFEEGEMARFVAKIGPLQVGEGTARLRRAEASTPEVSLIDRFSNREMWHFESRVIATKPVSLFYRVNDSIKVWMRSGSFLPHRQEIRIDESNERATRGVLYDHVGGVAHFWRDRTYYRKERDKEKVTVREDVLVPGSFDPVSLLMRLRCVEADIGDVLEIPVHENGKNQTVEIHVEKIEAIKTPLGRKEAIRAQIKLFFEGKLANKRPFIVWVSNDERRIPLKAVADLPFANLKGVIVGYRASSEAEIEGELDPSFLDRPETD